MPFTPQTLRDHVVAAVLDNTTGQITPEVVREAFLVAADVMAAVYPDGAAADSAAEALTYRNQALTYRNDAEGFADDAEAAAIAAAASAASVDGSLLLTKSGNLAGLTDIAVAIANLGLTNRILRAGAMMDWPKSTPPAGALERNGAAISRTTYADLFAVIGTTYGAGNGTTTFNIPDDRGLSTRYWDNGRGLDPGRVFGSYQDDAFQTHGHTGATYGAGGHAHGVYDPGHAHDLAIAVEGSTAAGSATRFRTGNTTLLSTTWRTVAGATTGIGIYAVGDHSHAVDVYGPNSGRYTSETRVKSRAYLPIIFY